MICTCRYFDTVLYADVTLSTHPPTHTPNMASWFPIYFPLQEPVYCPAGTPIEAHMWRCGAAHKVRLFSMQLLSLPVLCAYAALCCRSQRTADRSQRTADSARHCFHRAGCETKHPLLSCQLSQAHNCMHAVASAQYATTASDVPTPLPVHHMLTRSSFHMI